MTFWVMMDHLGLLIAANLCCAGAAGIPLIAAGWLTAIRNPWAMGAGIVLVSALFVAGIPVLAAGLAHLAKTLIDKRDASLADFFSGVRCFASRAMVIGAVFIGLAFGFAASIRFYADVLGAQTPWIGFGLSGVSVWCLVFVVLMGQMLMPALVEKRGSMAATFKLAALLALDRPFVLAGALIMQALMLLGFVMLAPVAMLVAGAGIIVFQMAVYEQLARAYALAELAQSGCPVGAEGIPLAGFASGLRAIRKDGVLCVDESQDDWLNRGFRDLIFPWKS